jgi:zinc/manganese transport system substrate-binding protein
MMRRWTYLVSGYLVICILGWAGPTAAAEKLKVVASFSILADFVAQVGGDRVSVTSLVGPDSDAHVYEPTPGDVRKVAEAKAIIVNGLGLEGWLPRLLEASGVKSEVIEASSGVRPLTADDDEDDYHHEHGHDPHAFQNIRSATIYIKNIAHGLCRSAPGECDQFQANAATYAGKLWQLDKEIRAAIERIPREKRSIITSHDAFGYFGHAYGLRFLAPEGVSTEAEASAEDVAKLIQQIRQQKASALFVENISDKRLIEQIGRETGLKIAGALFSDALSKKDGPAATYIDMMRHNVHTILTAINEGS